MISNQYLENCFSYRVKSVDGRTDGRTGR